MSVPNDDGDLNIVGLEVVCIANLDRAAIQLKELRALDVDQVTMLVVLDQVRAEAGPVGLDVRQGIMNQRQLVVGHIPARRRDFTENKEG